MAADNKVGRASADRECREGLASPRAWLSLRDLKTAETPRERAQRCWLLRPEIQHRESRILPCEQALIAGDQATARERSRFWTGEPVTARSRAFERGWPRLGLPDEAR